MKLENVNTLNHHFEEDINGVMVCELCQKWFCPADHEDEEIQDMIHRLGPCPNSILR